MPLARRAGWRGASPFEIALVVLLVSALLLALEQRARLLREQAEGLAAEQVLGALRIALVVRTARAAAGGRSEELVALVGANPIALLEQPPWNYLGEFAGVPPWKIPGARWYFDADRRVLVYHAGKETHFGVGSARGGQMEFKLVPVFTDTDRDGRYEPDEDEFHGVALEAAAPSNRAS